MALIRATSGSGGGGSYSLQYAGASPNVTGSITADHSADKVIAIIDSPSYASYFTVTIKGTTYTLSSITDKWDSGVNESGMGLGYYIINVSVDIGDVITFKPSGAASAMTIVF